MRTVLHISLTVLLSFSGIIFAVAEGHPLAGFSLVIALATLFVVDLEELFSVPPVVANLFGIVAFAVAGYEFSNGQIESRLLGGGHLIVYLTWVFLIQKKGVSQIWWLCALSILQVATASVLTMNVWFGAALIAYVFVATWTLSVFLLYRSAFLDSTSQIHAGDDQTRIVVGDTWKGIARDVDSRIINLRFVSVNGVMTVLGLCLSFLFFLLTPRIWIGQFNFLSDEALAGQPLTGFTEEVRLGDMGEILENDDIVLEVELFLMGSDRPLSPASYNAYFGPAPLFRGAVLEEYENGRWRQVRFRTRSMVNPLEDQVDIVQRYTLHPIGSPTLFSFGDEIGCQSLGPNHVRREPYSDELLRGSSTPDTPPMSTYEYVIFASRRPFDSTHFEERQDQRIFSRDTIEFRTQYLSLLYRNPPNLERLNELARSVVSESASNMQRAVDLERYLQSADNFSYTMNLSIDDASIDPVEDFLFNRKSGHCEYFASAMALMLRAVGIPSRVISGFKGGVYDPERRRHIVRQYHAHSWVEAYIDGQWKVFDPTPPARDDAVQQQQNQSLSLWGSLVKARQMWDQGMRMSRTQQRDLVYAPIVATVRDLYNSGKGLTQGRLPDFRAMIEFFKSPENWFSARGAIFVIVLSLFISGCVWLAKRLLQLFSQLQSRRRNSKREYRQVEFYERFLKILKAHGIRQQPTQTALEFVQDSLAELNSQLESHGLQRWPHELAGHFYDVRFGGIELSPQLSLNIDQKLRQLEQCLQHRAR